MNHSENKALYAAVESILSFGGVTAPNSFMDMYRKNKDKLSYMVNGCGAAGAKFDFVPDKIYGTYIGAACAVHDYEYYVGLTNEDKEAADRRFRNNLLRLIDRDCKKKRYKPKFLMRKRAQAYYYAVKCFGGTAFWEGKLDHSPN